MLFWDDTHRGGGCVSQDGALWMLPWVHEVGGHAWMPRRYFAWRATARSHPPAVQQMCYHIKLFLPLHFKHSKIYRCADRYLRFPLRIMSQWPLLTTSTAPWVWWRPPPPKDTLTFPNWGQRSRGQDPTLSSPHLTRLGILWTKWVKNKAKWSRYICVVVISLVFFTNSQP